MRWFDIKKLYDFNKCKYFLRLYVLQSLQIPSVTKRVKISLSNLFNYFSVSGDSKQIKNFPHVVTLT